jgi:hypothetical protein
VRRSPEGPWRLEAISVLSPERARALAEREHARQGAIGAQFRMRQYADIKEIVDRLDG